MATHRLTRAARRAWPLLAAAAVLASAAMVSAAVGGAESEVVAEAPADDGSWSPGDAATGRAPVLRVSGHVRGLYPGARKRFRVRVRNLGGRDLVLGEVLTEVGDAGPECGGENVRISEPELERAVPARGSARVRLRAAMARDAPDACQRARFPLEFSVSARARP